MSTATPPAATLADVMKPYRALPVATPAQVEAGFRWLADTMLDALNSTTTPAAAAPGATAAPALLTVEQMAKALGMSATSFARIRKAPGFPELRLDSGGEHGILRFDPEAVKNYITEQARIKREMAK